MTKRKDVVHVEPVAKLSPAQLQQIISAPNGDEIARKLVAKNDSDDAPQPRLPAQGRCAASAPCGERCAMYANYSHCYHSCRDANCQVCHDPVRFRRAAK